MKTNFILAAATLLLTATACKNDGGNKGVIQTEQNTAETTEGLSGSHTYKATDGSRAKVTFDQKNKNVIIYANNQQFQLDEKGGGHYERSGITADVKGDSLIITQGDNVIDLVLDK